MSRATQRESREFAEEVFKDPSTLGRFRKMAAESAEREGVPDDFSAFHFERGDRVRFRDAAGAWHEGRALGPVHRGQRWPVVYVCDEATWVREGPLDGLGRHAWPAPDVEHL